MEGDGDMRRVNGRTADVADDSVAADLLKGAIAGAIGVWVMDRVDWFMFRHEDPAARRRTRDVRPGGRDPAHVIAGEAARLMGVELSSPRQNPAGLGVHYSLGIMPGALYGTLRDRVPGLGAGRGLLYGLGMFVVEDELINPALGVAAGPRRYPWQAHARGLVAHLVLGFVTDGVLDILNKAGRHT